MNANRLLAFTTSSLVAALALVACDPGFDDAEFEQLELDDSEISPETLELLEEDGLEPLAGEGPDELDAASNEQAVSSCDFGLPDLVIGGSMNQGTASGVLPGIPTGTYTFVVTEAPNNPAPLQYWTTDINGETVDHSPSLYWPPFTASAGDSFDFFMQAFSTGQPGWTYDFEIELYSYPGNQLICSDTTSLELQPHCEDVSAWWTQPWPIPVYDTANCYIAPLPVGATGFVWSNNWYVTPTNGTQCSIGTYDGANCYIGSPRGGHTAFIWNGNMYYTL